MPSNPEPVPESGLKRALASLGLLPLARRMRRAFDLLFALPLALVRHPGSLPAGWRWWRCARLAARERAEEKRLTVAIDISAFWEPLTGIGWYLFRLIEELADRRDLSIRLYGPDLINMGEEQQPVVVVPSGPAIEHVTYELKSEVAPLAILVGRLRPLLAAWLVRSDRNKVRFAPNYFLPGRLRFAGGPLVATIHDLGFRRFPETLRAETLAELTRHLERTTRKAAVIMTDSEAVRRELIEDGLAPAERVRTVHLAAGMDVEASAPLPESIPERYVLHVGTIEPRKRVELLIEAMRRLQSTSLACGLILCGRLGWKTAEIESAIAAGQDEGWLIHLGYADAALVPTLYRHAQLVAVPSVYEGFGLPALEAMLVGAPLLASDIPVLREVAGDAAAYVQPDDVDALEQGLRKLLADDRTLMRLAELGPERAKRFNWPATGAAVFGAWQDAAGSDSTS